MKKIKTFSLGIAMLISFLTFAQEKTVSNLSENKQLTTPKPLHQDEKPLVYINGKTAGEMDYFKYSSFNNIKDKNIESTVVLNNPLYIINGKSYTEKKLFGPNPTANYASLKPKYIREVLAFHGREATEKYGSRARNGVIQITLKTESFKTYFKRTEN
ncbi:hypothetical protein ABGT15_07625 [Flavobacterium enshiense]|uniref:hypothetical protein n=1 Tax=Flavobacterium enshiense TaxID=1341165 RepID=UPI00345CC802